MAIHFLFPADPIRSTAVDEAFADQLAAIRDVGISTSLYPDPVHHARRPLRDIPTQTTVVYRGWMLNTSEYNRMAASVESAGGTPLRSPQSYLAAHHLPNWYPLIADITPETRVLLPNADWETELRSLGWEAYFIKDFVKSLKTSRGSIVRDPSELRALLQEMERVRGETEGGLCVRKVEAFVSESETRFFVLFGKAFESSGEIVPAVVTEVVSRIALPFFSVDVILRVDGVLRVVELGDGQLSDLVGWTASAFAAMWREARDVR